MPPKYSIITTCKGRLRDLKRTLPVFLKQPNTEVIVVDYDCPDGTSAYVARFHPEARVVSVTDRQIFSHSKARNLGAAQTSGEFLIFLDADLVITEHFVSYIDSRMDSLSLAHFGPRVKNSLRGSCVVGRKMFGKIGGYDELLGYYEAEDLDFYLRLKFIGAKAIILEPFIVAEAIEQSVAEKVGATRGVDLKKKFLKGQLYISAKEMVMRIQGSAILPLALRNKLYAEVEKNLDAVYTGEKGFSLEVNFPDKYKRGFLQEWEFSQSITVKARRKKTIQEVP